MNIEEKGVALGMFTVNYIAGLHGERFREALEKVIEAKCERDSMQPATTSKVTSSNLTNYLKNYNLPLISTEREGGSYFRKADGSIEVDDKSVLNWRYPGRSRIVDEMVQAVLGKSREV